MNVRITTLGLAVAALIAFPAQRSATAQFSGCSGQLPSGLSVYEELAHDGGGGVTHLVTAGGPGGTQRTIHHGVRFIASGELITHVCLYADDAGDPMELRFYQGDTTQYNDIRPGGLVRQVTDTIQGGWQLVDVSPPVTASGIFWIVAVFPNAVPAQGHGHMGVGLPATGNLTEAYVGIMPGAPGGQEIWTDYDQVPGSAYAGFRPILRGLHLDATNCAGAGTVVNSFGNHETTEGGGSASFFVALSGPTPTENVLVLLDSTDPGEGVPNPSVLIFTPANAANPQAVTVTGVDDPQTDGDVAYTITMLTSSLDACFHGQTSSVDFVNLDDETCPGDTNGDGVVNVDDLTNVILDWGSGASAHGGDVAGSTPGSPPDGVVDINDLNAVILGWGLCP